MKFGQPSWLLGKFLKWIIIILIFLKHSCRTVLVFSNIHFYVIRVIGANLYPSRSRGVQTRSTVSSIYHLHLLQLLESGEVMPMLWNRKHVVTIWTSYTSYTVNAHFLRCYIFNLKTKLNSAYKGTLVILMFIGSLNFCLCSPLLRHHETCFHSLFLISVLIHHTFHDFNSSRIPCPPLALCPSNLSSSHHLSSLLLYLHCPSNMFCQSSSLWLYTTITLYSIPTFFFSPLPLTSWLHH